jgi:hypothetical protein
MTLILNCFILGCFGSIGAAIALLFGLSHPVHLSIATGLGIALPIAALLLYIARTNKDTEAR